jgi:molecular chaperone DnaK
LSKEEIEKLKAEAAKHADEDKKKRDAAEARNIAENLIYVSEKSLKDAGEKVTPEIRASVEAKINDLKKVKDSGDVEIIKKATDELSTEIQKIGGAMYNKDNKADDTSSAKQSE